MVEQSAEKFQTAHRGRLSMRVDYIMVSNATKKAVWLRKFITKHGVAPSFDGLVLFYYDSTRAIAQAKESKAHQWMKHILHHNHLVWEIVDQGDVDLQKID